jgi:hypothetical protein
VTDQGEAHRSRRLRKYEAAALPALRCEGPPALDLISPFGPMIGRGVAPPSLLERLNGYAAGHVSPTASTEFLIPPDLALGDGLTIGRSLETLVARWAQAVDGAPPGRVRIETIWIVSQYADSASPMHFHSGDASGVIYLATPEIVAEAEEEAKTYISGRRAGYLNFLIGGKQRFSKSLFSVKPRLGDMWVFPGWLLHGVEPFRGSGERRSLAFNAYVDD